MHGPDFTDIFDTHAHYNDEAFQEDGQELLASLPGQGIARVVNVGASLASCRQSLELARRWPHVYCALGVHPSECGELNQEGLDWLRRQCQEEKCVAVGEIGLDYHWEGPGREVQKEWFVRQLRLARECGLPVVIHSRDAACDTADILRGEKTGEIGGVIHCYSYSREMAREFLNMGFYFGIGGVVTFRNARKLKEAVEYIPLDRLVLETDCPYLAPEPWRGKRNSSLYLPLVAAAAAAIKGVSQEELLRAVWENSLKLYRMENLRAGRGI